MEKGCHQDSLSGSSTMDRQDLPAKVTTMPY
jgi:hypothetical protein